jgi:hypothetical protein
MQNMFNAAMKTVAKLNKNTVINKIAKLITPTKLKGWLKEWIEFYQLKSNAKRPETFINESELRREFEKSVQYLLKHTGRENIGDYLEFGVYFGDSLYLMHSVLEHFGLNNVRLFGFDSFQGLPEVESNIDKGIWSPGEFKSNYEFVKRELTQKGVDWNKTFLVNGWFSDTLNDEFIKKHNMRRASLILIDCDMYSSTTEALKFCDPLIKELAIIIFDDWGAADLDIKNLGEKRAFDEFLSMNPKYSITEFGSYLGPQGLPHGKVFIVNKR